MSRRTDPAARRLLAEYERVTGDRTGDPERFVAWLLHECAVPFILDQLVARARGMERRLGALPRLRSRAELERGE